MKRRCAVRIISFSVALFLVTVGMLARTATESKHYSRMLRNNYMRSLDDLCDGLANINTELKKSANITTSSQLCSIAANIYRDAGSVKSALSQLPLGDTDLSVLYKFLSQAGDYSLSIARQSIAGKALGSEERENFNLLSKTAETLFEEAENMRIRFESGEDMVLGTDTEYVSDETEALHDSVESYPSLIYDGPYSDHMLNRQSVLLAEADYVTRETAAESAAVFFGCDGDELEYSGESNGQTETYRFERDSAVAEVTKKGGYVLYYRNYVKTGKETYTYEQAVELAKQRLFEYTGEQFEDSYYFADEGVCTVNFAYKEGNTVCYADLIKVGIALDSGETVLFEAGGYITNHTRRTIKTPSATEDEARAVLSENLTAISVKRALIPSAWGEEIACYEFLCEDADKNEILVYVNSDTLAEEQVFTVIKTEGGTLTK